MAVSNQHVFSLYRTYLRQVGTLPHIYLRYFFRIKGADDFRSVLNTKSPELRSKKLKRVSKDLRRLRAAGERDSIAFDRVLGIAYGRVGRLRWELIEPFLSDTRPSSPSQRVKLCLPTYSPELVALLTSSVSRTTRPLRRDQLVSPPGLRARNLENTVPLGSPSRRREYNIRWRFFKNESKKVYAPLQVSLHHPANQSNLPFDFGFQNAVTLHELLALGGSPSLSEPSTKQKRQEIQKVSGANPFDRSLPTRWLRRRYQALLGRVPLLILRPLGPRDNPKRTYDIQLADNATTASRPHASQSRFVDTEDMSWLSDISP